MTLPIGEDEKCYVIEKGERLAIVRSRHSERYPFTPSMAAQLARDCREIDGDGWTTKEITTTAELELYQEKLKRRIDVLRKQMDQA